MTPAAHDVFLSGGSSAQRLALAVRHPSTRGFTAAAAATALHRNPATRNASTRTCLPPSSNVDAMLFWVYKACIPLLHFKKAAAYLKGAFNCLLDGWCIMTRVLLDSQTGQVLHRCSLFYTTQDLNNHARSVSA
ncbi:unnamed protein product [Miscanthus lutarioriparius]|uniref:Uncharacterized protein n=1 Tax=Miscanthus lutarioriparius TaxID=422564 RepID=A0A811NVJ2_9POAL|nr:unnamed protein product [Miscanthus lutarioriparius]